MARCQRTAPVTVSIAVNVPAALACAACRASETTRLVLPSPDSDEATSTTFGGPLGPETESAVRSERIASA